MKHKLRDFIILLISASGMSVIYRKWVSRKGPLVRVLCFHDVPDRLWFASILDLLVAKYNVLTPKQFHEKAFVSNKINILITFDDGYQTWVDNCLPELEERELKAIFFISSGLLDAAGDKNVAREFIQQKLKLQRSYQLLNWQGAEQIVKKEHTVGGHTVNHYSLAKLSEDEACHEIVSDKEKLQSALGVSVVDFAYPFGRPIDRSACISELLVNSGYRFVYTTDASFVSDDQVISIPRLCIEQQQGNRNICNWIGGGYDLVRKIQ